MGIERALVNDKFHEIINLGKCVSLPHPRIYTVRGLEVELADQVRGFAADPVYPDYAARLTRRFYPVLERWGWKWREIDDCGDAWDRVFFSSRYELVATRYENVDGTSCLEEERADLAKYRAEETCTIVFKQK